MDKKILIIGSGGREHALAWKLKQSPKVDKIYIAPGNAGTAQVGKNVPIAATDIPALIKFVKENGVDLTIVGPDDPLALGIVNEFQKRRLKIWGPTKAAAQIEASKVFAKRLMRENQIPTATFKTFTDYNEAWGYVKKTGAPIVIKASGLALGKGVTVAQTLDEAEDALRKIMIDKIFGEAGNEVVVEEYLEGQEISIHVFSDGNTFKLLPTSQDHKAIFDGDKGPNTGGMGTIAPLPWVNQEMMDNITAQIVKPALDGLKKLGGPFVGLLYPGLIVNLSSFAKASEDDPLSNKSKGVKVIEFNSRFGDPECESYMRLLKTDLLDILETCVDGKLDKINIEWENKFACCIMLASGGYPGKYEKGFGITGVEEANKLEDIVVFHAGTAIKDGKLVTNGGRVLGVTAVGDDLKSALNKAYSAIKLINFEGMQYRKDIGAKSLQQFPPLEGEG